MRIGAFQFKTNGSVQDNYNHIEAAVKAAACEKVRLLVFSECALCGYPPVETEAIGRIDFAQVSFCLNELKNLARKHDMYLAVGTARKDVQVYNSVVVIGPEGEITGIYDKRALWGWDSQNRGCAGGARGYRVFARIRLYPAIGIRVWGRRKETHC